MISDHLGGHRHSAAGRSVLRCVLQQIDQDSFDQQRIEAHQRQVAGDVHVHHVAQQRRAHGIQRRTHHLFQRLPLQIEFDFTAFYARHVQKIADQRDHPARLILDGLRGLQLRRRQRRFGERQGLREAHENGQRRPQIVRQGGEQRISQPLRLHPHQCVLRHLHVVYAFERDGYQCRKGVEQLPLFGYAQQPPVLRFDGQYAARPDRRAQRNVQHLAARQGIRAESRRFTLVECPLRDADVDGERRVGPRGCGTQLTGGIRQ